MTIHTKSLSTHSRSSKPLRNDKKSKDENIVEGMDKNSNHASQTSELRILNHSMPRIATGNRLGRLHIYGNQNAKHLIIMSVGYPDTQSSFTPMAKHLVSDNDDDCLVGITCPPGYDDEINWRTDYPSEGFTFDDWIIHMEEAVKTLRNYSTRPVKETTLTGIFHDWGIMMGTMYMNHATNLASKDTKFASLGMTLDRLVIYDVLMPPHPQTKGGQPTDFENKSLWNKFCFMSYQLVLAGAFLLNRYSPFPFVPLLYYIVANTFLNAFGMFPISKEDRMYVRDHIKMESLNDLQRIWYMAYPYFQFWKHIFQGKFHELVNRLVLPQDISKNPVLYLHGTSKPYDLGEPNAVELLRREEAQGRPSRVIDVDHAGHWLYEQQPEICYAAMKEFFEATVHNSQSTSSSSNVPKTTQSRGVAAGSENLRRRSNVKSNAKPTQRAAKETKSVRLQQLPKNYGLSASNSSDSTSTVESTSAWQETSHNEDPSVIDIHANGSSESISCHDIVDGNVMKSGHLDDKDSRRSSRRKSRRRNSQTQGRKSKHRMNIEELLEASKNTAQANQEEMWKSPAALRLYVVVFVSVSLRKFVVLQGISVLILFHIFKLLLSWFLYIKDAKEISEMRELAIWWMNFGLRFATKTVDGDKIHSILTAFTLNFWKGTGFNYATSIYQSIAKDGREKLLRQAKENMDRTRITNMNFLKKQQRPGR